MLETIQLRGSLKLLLNDLEGNVVDERDISNLLVLGGRSWILGQLETTNQATAQTMSNYAIGSGAVAPTTADTALGNEVKRLAISAFATTGLTQNPPSFQAQVSFATSDANTTLSECGIFNSTSGGTMIARATFASFVKATSNTLAISHTISG